MTATHARRRLLAMLGGLAVEPLWAQSSDGRRYPDRDDVQQFVEGLVAESGLPRTWVERVLAEGRYSAAAERLTTPSLNPPPRDWRAYRARTVDSRRIDEGVTFARAQQRWLVQMEAAYGVPAEIVVAIIGIESFYGRQVGNFRTLDVLLTLAFDYPRRSAQYREQLAEFLRLVRERGLDPLAVRGSFAGAIGLPQFMPASIRAYAVDFDGDGQIDLGASRADAIGSIGRYLAAQGWQRELPIALPARADDGHQDVLGHGIRAAWRWQGMADLGVAIDGNLPPDTEVLLIDLPGTDNAGRPAVEYRVGTVNLAALLHYNRSYFYAAAVVDLAQEIATRV